MAGMVMAAIDGPNTSNERIQRLLVALREEGRSEQQDLRAYRHANRDGHVTEHSKDGIITIQCAHCALRFERTMAEGNRAEARAATIAARREMVSHLANLHGIGVDA